MSEWVSEFNPRSFALKELTAEWACHFRERSKHRALWPREGKDANPVWAEARLGKHAGWGVSDESKNSEKGVGRRSAEGRQSGLQGSENSRAGVEREKQVNAAEAWRSRHGGVIIFSKQKPRIYGPNEAECSKSGMSQKIPEMMSPIHWLVRARSTASCTHSSPYAPLESSLKTTRH